MKRLVPGALAICLAASLWGLDGVVLTPRLHALPVLFVVFLLHLVPFLIMQPVLGRTYRALAAMPGRDWATLILVASTGGIVGTFAIVKALFLVEFNQLSVVVLLQKLQPVFVIALAAVVLKEKVSLRFLAWATAALVGAYLMTFGLKLPEMSAGSTTTAAAAWATLAAAAFGSATVFGKRILSALDFRQATFGRYGCTVILAAILLVATGYGFPWGEVTVPQWSLVLLIGLTTGSGAIFLYYYGLSRVPASISAICELCLPLTAILLDFLVNDSVLGPWQWLGAGGLIFAIWRISRPSARASLVPERLGERR